MVQFASYLRRILCKTRLIFPRINGPNVCLLPSAKLPLTIAISFAILSFVFASQAGRARSNIVIYINPAPTQMIVVTEKPKIPSKFAIREARYKEFGSNSLQSSRYQRVLILVRVYLLQGRSK